MKKFLTLIFCIIHFSLIAQTSVDILTENAVGHIQGITRTYDPQLGKRMLDTAILQGSATAMNAMGNIYLKGKIVKRIVDSALYLYKKSADGGCVGAYINLGNIYRVGKYTKQDFVKAVYYYKLGVEKRDIECKSLLAYMYFKGFGIKQDYIKSFSLNKECVKAGHVSAMYFLGLCYKNGYGTSLNNDLALELLQKSAERNNRIATSELKEAKPENIIDPVLERELEALKTSKESFIASNKNDYQGIYKGYAIYYDWSGKIIVDLKPLTLSLTKTTNKYLGIWKEGDYDEVEIEMSKQANNFNFEQNCTYKRNDRYSARTPETWSFNSAKLDLYFKKDSFLLHGFVQFYSKERREPGRPLQIFLKKSFNDFELLDSKVLFTLYPNPTSSFTIIDFELNKTAKISFKIFTQNGLLVYNDYGKLLPMGSYKCNIPTDNLVAGTYSVQLLVNGKMSTTKILVKQ